MHQLYRLLPGNGEPAAIEAVREKKHSEDAAPIYLRYAEAGVAATSNGRYEEPVSLLAKTAGVSPSGV